MTDIIYETIQSFNLNLYYQYYSLNDQFMITVPIVFKSTFYQWITLWSHSVDKKVYYVYINFTVFYFVTTANMEFVSYKLA